MINATLFDLENRVPQVKPFSSIDDVRSYDLGMRKSALVAYLKPAKRILSYCNDSNRDLFEVGTGTGLLSLYVGGKRPEHIISSVEENVTLLEVAEENLSLSVWCTAPSNIEFELCKLHKFPFANASADIVYSFSSMHLWKKPVETLKEISRICKPGGVVLLFDTNRHAEEGHITFVLQFVKEGANEFMDSLRASYSPREVKDLLAQAGLAEWRVYEDELGLVVSSVVLDDLEECP
ncbi:class I SAM-dependent methyltransferase [Massilia genomosp. 1]|uniref:Methyltransferase domain-containing protein n=1 Tax=Massilia genomosp. 1 TaxID=2609280 RepID=A0ABX0MUI9_9BURK|nr:class I SAM-dependent methyltransferase [Massilia genomosp. 1]NHZ64138.1 methyltransferase domain-containing protein [Massilia genomosp. 1]